MRQSAKALSTADAAYIAGMVDGEGTIALTRTNRGERRRPVVSISSNELALLTYIRTVIGLGKITRKAKREPHHSCSYAYVLASRQALSLLRTISPYLRSYKAERARLLLENYVSVTPRNGRYSEFQERAREDLEKRFFDVSIRAKSNHEL